MSGLDQAIQAAVSQAADGQALVGDWVLIYESQQMDEQGRLEYRVGVEMANNSVPVHRILGLLETAKVHYTSGI